MSKLNKIIIPILLLILSITLISCGKKEEKITTVELGSVTNLEVSDEYILSFNTVIHAGSYEIQIGQNKYTISNNTFDLKDVLTTDGLYTIWVCAKSNEKEYTDSSYTSIKVQFESYTLDDLRQDLVNKYASYGVTKSIDEVEDEVKMLNKRQNTSIKLSDTIDLYDCILCIKYNKNIYSTFEYVCNLGYTTKELSEYIVNIIEYSITTEDNEVIIEFLFSQKRTQLVNIIKQYLSYIYSIIKDDDFNNHLEEYNNSNKEDLDNYNIIQYVSNYILIVNPIDTNALLDTKTLINELLDYTTEYGSTVITDELEIIITLIKDLLNISTSYNTDFRLFLNDVISNITYEDYIVIKDSIIDISNKESIESINEYSDLLDTIKNIIDRTNPIYRENIINDLKSYYKNANTIDLLVKYIYNFFEKDGYEEAVINLKSLLNGDNVSLKDIIKALGIKLADIVNYINKYTDEYLEKNVTKDNINEWLTFTSAIATIINKTKETITSMTYQEFINSLKSIKELTEEQLNNISSIENILKYVIDMDELVDGDLVDSLQNLLNTAVLKLAKLKIKYLFN